MAEQLLSVPVLQTQSRLRPAQDAASRRRGAPGSIAAGSPAGTAPFGLARPTGRFCCGTAKYRTHVATRDEPVRAPTDRFKGTHNPLVAGSNPGRPVLEPIFRSSERESSLFTACSDGAVEQFGDLNMHYRHASTNRADNTRAGAV
jgi:hypothetical protein